MKKKFVIILSFFMILSTCYVSYSKDTGNKKVLPKTLIFKKIYEANEKAFTILIPKDWQAQGGIVRWDPSRAGGSGNSIEAKIDYMVMKDQAASVMLRIMPTIKYMDMARTNSPASCMFPTGSNYNGMMVCPLMGPGDFITRVIFPQLHPQAKNPQVVQAKELQGLAQYYYNLLKVMNIPLQLQYYSAMVTITYQEGGVNYKERIITTIEDFGPQFGVWGNKDTISYRAPVDTFSYWEPVIGIILNSIKPEPKWVAKEINSQIQNGTIAIQTQQDVQRIESAIVKSRQDTNEQINRDMFFTLNEQREYINPHTKEIEVGTNQYKYRWENPNGETIYTDADSYNPNYDKNINRTDYKLSVVKKGK